MTENSLVEEKCVACRGDAPRVSPQEKEELIKQIPQWRIVEKEGVEMLERKYDFPDFASALIFADKVGRLAEQEKHHPSLLVEWGKVTVWWWTHKIKGLHRNDFIMAAKTDSLYTPILKDYVES
ncbi:4a-hydroxytetrahydrobiopterin dehydratase [Candidatus Methylacidiphilum infernorum]|uniref:Putative pterin-4-alpha-carbinolamine dehydratase n=1 Tax=Candidatus Methylacidiphilum infernorum TaxID=511746 RepID=A0ABX7PUP9_9BACT|nr:4a-hydroxytetrahydrobiopterin dehydratase [Candidatus Methylacidiphilum infernorum]QSR86720.1 4a-hydroxytetrahydrobiopterin dehydratase [Candidatus Methylacidiphilum infernorum]